MAASTVSRLRCYLSKDPPPPTASRVVEWAKGHALRIAERAEEGDELDLNERFFPLLSTTTLGRVVLYGQQVPSTQSLLHEQLSDCPISGVVCVADEQLTGKGRGSNSWESPKGCLMFSFKTQYSKGENLPFVQYLVSLAMVKAIQRHAPSGTDLDLRIKWPNDIYGKGMKIGGVLCQSEFKNGSFDVTTGFGINLSNQKPTTCVNNLLAEAVGNTSESIASEVLLAEFFNEYERMHLEFLSAGFAPFQQDYIANWMHTNQSVTIEGNSQTGESSVTVTIKGLTPSGCLLAIDKNGKSFELYPDGNSFDFFSGLLKRKM